MARKIEQPTPGATMKPSSARPHTPNLPDLEGLSPAEITARWPADTPLACLVSGGPGRFARWSVFAPPVKTIALTDDAELWALLDQQPPRLDAHTDTDAPPFRGGLIGWIGYGIGAYLEPRAGLSPQPEPLAVLADCPDALVHDAATGRWSIVGDPDRLAPVIRTIAEEHGARGFSLGPLSSAVGQRAYAEGVRRAVEYIRAGDVFQVNLAHPLRARFEGSARALASTLFAQTGAWFGGMIELDPHAGDAQQPTSDRRCVLSVSPELFLRYDPADRSLLTSPMKGTRPAAADPEELRLAPKDRAELNMITDLMRNDLGRVASFGSVRVADPRRIERHAGSSGVIQASSEIAATLRPGLGLADLLRATLPAGSITGAPKVRAMQIIDELEPFPRGAYCGVLGFVSRSGHAEFSVAIRTATIVGKSGQEQGSFKDASLEYPVGAGIVADSDPDAEWAETLAKAGVFARLTEITDQP